MFPNGFCYITRSTIKHTLKSRECSARLAQDPLHMNKKKILIFGVIISTVALAIIFKFKSPQSSRIENDTWVQASPVKVASIPMQVVAIGTLSAKSVEITPAVSGHVEKISFEDGSFVKKGTILIELDEAIYKAQYESAKAKLAYSQSYFKRMSLLGKKGVVAKQVIDQAEADLKEKRANTQEIEVMLNKMKLKAPFDGVVGKSKINLGDYITLGKGVVELTDTSHLRAEYMLPEKYLPLIRLHQKVMVTTSAYPDKTFIGKVSFISPTINVENRSVALYADVLNPQNMLVPGLYVKISQSLGTTQPSLMVPAKSLVPLLEGEQVYKIVDNKAYGVKVMIGKRTKEEVQIIQGLTAKDVVITDGQFKIKNGMKVKIKI